MRSSFPLRLLNLTFDVGDVCAVGRDVLAKTVGQVLPVRNTGNAEGLGFKVQRLVRLSERGDDADGDDGVCELRNTFLHGIRIRRVDFPALRFDVVRKFLEAVYRVA